MPIYTQEGRYDPISQCIGQAITGPYRAPEINPATASDALGDRVTDYKAKQAPKRETEQSGDTDTDQGKQGSSDSGMGGGRPLPNFSAEKSARDRAAKMKDSRKTAAAEKDSGIEMDD